MNTRLAKSIATLYSRDWRERYGDEFVALLEALPPSPASIVDACLPALARHARQAALTAVLAVCAAVPVAALYHARPAVRVPATYAVAPARAVCRPYPKVSHSAFAGWHRCLD
ncbi:MAG TPA: hypothetical protein VGF98_13825 [Candidatus Tumulicola sp.]|jgi:hypothetical protein